ncbi:MAG: serine hydrolase [Candidatus Aminicenantales bacterium]
MKKISAGFVFAAILAAAVPAFSQALITPGGSTPGDAALISKIDVFLSGIYKPGEPGAAVLVKKNGRILLRQGYGLADLELGVPIEPDMIFRLGSITKQFTAAGILKLSEQGKLAVSDEITKFLPDFPTGGKKITIEHLLTHTSGIVSYTDLPEWLPLWRKDMSLDELIALFKDKPAEFGPGERWKYCNSGYILLGAVIEKVSGLAYRDFVKKEIFDPLGMTHSYYGDATRIIPRRIPGYQMGNAGFENAPYLSMTQPYAAGSLLSSVDDLAVWSEGLLAGRVLKKETLEKVFTPYVLGNGRSTGYGYGWFISGYHGRRVIEHGGGINGFITHILFLPEDGVFVTVLSNGIGGGRNPEAEAFRIATLVLGDPYVDPTPVSLAEKDLDPLVGVYVNDAGVERYITRDGNRLFSQMTGGAKFEIHPFSPNEFFFKDSLSRLTVRRTAEGRVAGLEFAERIGPVAFFARTSKPLPAERKEVAVDPALYDRLVGEYELTPGFTVVVTKEGNRLMGQATGQEKLELFPESETAFFLKEVDAQIVFTLDASGKATALTLTQGGQTLPAKKIK